MECVAYRIGLHIQELYELNLRQFQNCVNGHAEKENARIEEIKLMAILTRAAMHSKEFRIEDFFKSESKKEDLEEIKKRIKNVKKRFEGVGWL